ncbi:Serine hydrolase FSH [Melia azedarach]|uniref:Serine hydrolase FSH n=1 Tax=Melia azedarach TaxID=155640 RepID=A0ACC1XSW1_MELAZ|nr:Serine hydrolase FSH [Melia azedarach]
MLTMYWSPEILDELDLHFLDGPCPALGPSEVETLPHFPPPYYEWFHTDQNKTQFWHFNESVAYVEDYMIKNGPFDGLMGFSQGAALSSALIGMQLHGDALTKVPPLKFVMLISGSKFGYKTFGTPKLAVNAYSTPIQLPSLHFIGDKDFLKKENLGLLDAYLNPVVIHHPEGHKVPRLDANNTKVVLGFIEKIGKLTNSRP